MLKKVLAVLSGAAVFLIVSGPVSAHHSDSMYDEEHFVSLTGTVNRFEFVNPHVLIHLDVKDDKGNIVTWTTLGGPPNRMAKGGGWTSKIFKQGEELTILGFPFRDGRPGMLFQKILRAGGEDVRISETVTNFSTRLGKELPIAHKYGAKSQ